MAGRINLNSLYKAINKAMDIQSDKQLELFQGAGSKINRSMVNGFWRREDDSRYKHVTPTLLKEYCFALQRRLDLAASESSLDLVEPILQEVIETLRNQEQINLEEMIDRIESHET